MKKHLNLGIGNYYFSVRNGSSDIMIKRKKKQEAVNAFLSYQKIGKTCEWHGCWNGKEFKENTNPQK